MRGICTDGPAQGWTCDNLPEPAPSKLLAPHDLDDDLPGAEAKVVPPGGEFPGMAGDYTYKLDAVEQATMPGATEVAAHYLYDAALDQDDGYMPSVEDWRPDNSRP